MLALGMVLDAFGEMGDQAWVGLEAMDMGVRCVAGADQAFTITGADVNREVGFHVGNEVTPEDKVVGNLAAHAGLEHFFGGAGVGGVDVDRVIAAREFGVIGLDGAVLGQQAGFENGIAGGFFKALEWRLAHTTGRVIGNGGNR